MATSISCSCLGWGAGGENVAQESAHKQALVCGLIGRLKTHAGLAHHHVEVRESKLVVHLLGNLCVLRIGCSVYPDSVFVISRPAELLGTAEPSTNGVQNCMKPCRVCSVAVCMLFNSVVES